MADNVLAELFSAIAFEIREGLGPIGLIKPADFPARTRDIVKLINSGGTGGNTNYIVASGTFKAAGTGVETITHNLGVVPDYFMIQWTSLGKAPETSAVISASGYSSRFFSANPDAKGTVLLYRSDSGTMAGLSVGSDYPIDGNQTFSGHPRSATETTIVVGDSGIPLDTAQGVSYTWCAIGNMVGQGSGGGAVVGEWVSAEGSFTAEATSATIEHNLGVVPDVFMVTSSISGQVAERMTDQLCLISSTRVSERLIEEAGLTYSGVHFILSKKMLMSMWISDGVETPTPSLGEPCNATKMTIMVGGGAGGGLIVGQKYSWIAIGRKS